jgi:hypothetical protein
MSLSLVESAGGKVMQANADGAYDSNESFKTLDGKHIMPAIKKSEEMLAIHLKLKSREKSMHVSSVN